MDVPITPWESCPELWKDEKAYCQWLRSQSRRIWSRHPVKLSYMRAHAVAITPEIQAANHLSLRAKKCYLCEMCGTYHLASNIEVDHIEMAGSFNTVKEWHNWLDKLLLIGFDGIRILCKACHSKVSYSQKMGCSIQEAEIQKEAVEFSKKPAMLQKEHLLRLGVEPANTAAKRREQYYEWLSNRPNGTPKIPE